MVQLAPGGSRDRDRSRDSDLPCPALPRPLVVGSGSDAAGLAPSSAAHPKEAPMGAACPCSKRREGKRVWEWK